MRGNLLKKVVASAVAFAMTAQFAFIVNAAPGNLYTQDFEGVAISDVDYSIAGQTTARILTNTADNSTSFFNVYTDNAGGGRLATLNLPGAYGAGVPVKVSFLMRIVGTNKDASEFALKDSSGATIFNFTSNSYLSSPQINGEAVTLTTTRAGVGKLLGLSDYDTSGWLKFEAKIDFRTSPSVVDLTVTDITNNDTVVYDAKTTTTAQNIKQLYIMQGRSNGAFAFDDIVIDEIDPSELDQSVTYTVKFVVEGEETSEVVAENDFVTKIPETTKIGYLFKGWSADGSDELVSSEVLAVTPITADVTYTAVYEVDEDYIEPMVDVQFSEYPTGESLVAGADANTAASNNIAVKVTGELGTDLTVNQDPRVDDFNIEYQVIGFNWKSHDKAPTADSDEWPYCDSYGRVVISDDGNSIDFQLKSHPFNYYGQVKAIVTYNGQVKEISKPLVYIGDANANTNSSQILPRGGYYEDFNAYSPDMVGYEAATSPENRGATDVVTDNWASYGGNVRTVKITEENGSRFLRLEATGTKSSSFAANQITAVTDAQVVFDQMVRFYNSDSSILLKSANPVTWNDNATSFGVNYKNGELLINDSKIANINSAQWYRVLITSDVTSAKCYAEVYNEAGEKLGASKVVSFTNAGSTNPTFYMFRTPDASPGKLDFNNVKITRAQIDEDSFNLSATDQTLAIPDEGEDNVTSTITVSARTTEGLPAIGKAEWTITDPTVSGVTITPSAEDTQTAQISVAPGATPGDLPISVTINGKSVSTTLTLTSSKDSIKFEESTSSISIPLSKGIVDNYTFRAIVVDGDGQEISGKDITYELYDSKNVNVIEAPAGMTFENGVMQITSDVKATVLYVRATSTNTQGEVISKSVRVDIHGLAFDFGAGTEEDVVEGYTSVTPTTIYSQSVGYGIEGAATAGGEASLTDASADYLEGTYTFKANVEPNKIYNVQITYTGALSSEWVNNDLSGVALSNSSFTEVTYLIPVFDGVLDLALSSGKIASIVIEPLDEKTPGNKPHIFSVGDSTIANNGSWAYVLARDYVSVYPELAEVAEFTNNGRGGKNLLSYYTGGDFRNVLINIRPGDYVVIGSMGTNGMGSTFEADVNYYIDCCLALGANVMLNSYSPHGAVSGYESGYKSSTNTFNSYRQDSYDVIIRNIYETRKNELAGFVEIGKNADAAFNAYVADYAANGYSSKDEAAQAIISCFGDHNHYSNGVLACNLMLGGYGDVDGIVDQFIDIISSKPDESGVTSVYDGTKAEVTFTNLDGTSAVIYVAEYTDSILTGVKMKNVAVNGNTVTESVEYTANNAENVKVFVWTDNQEVIPSI